MKFLRLDHKNAILFCLAVLGHSCLEHKSAVRERKQPWRGLSERNGGTQPTASPELPASRQGQLASYRSEPSGYWVIQLQAARAEASGAETSHPTKPCPNGRFLAKLMALVALSHYILG